MSGVVVPVTKLHAPVRRPGLVAREALVELLTRDRRALLTLVSAPPGSGKTTLLGEWRESPHEERPFAWLSLDSGDADPAQFWTCVVEAVRTCRPGFGERVLAALRAGGAGLTDVVVPLVINEAAAGNEPLVLVLADLHVLGAASQVHHPLGFLLDRAPPPPHIAVATRSDPPLPLPRLRARGELVELRGRDLR